MVALCPLSRSMIPWLVLGFLPSYAGYPVRLEEDYLNYLDMRVPANAGSTLKYLSARPCSKEFLDAIL